MPWSLRPSTNHVDPLVPFRKRISGIEKRLSAASRKGVRRDDLAQRAQAKAESLRSEIHPSSSPKLERLEREAVDREEDARAMHRLVETLSEALASARRELVEMQQPPKVRKGNPNPPAVAKRRRKQRP